MKYITKNNLTIELVLADITKEETDAIVNAANPLLKNGGGVCGAIYDAAGKDELLKESLPLGPINYGEAVITSGCKLKAKYIIHTPGPDYDEIDHRLCPKLLKNSYFNSLKLADEYNLESISFPSISTGIYNYPIEEATRIAISTFLEYVPKTLKKVRMCFLKQYQLNNYKLALEALTNNN